MGTGAEGCVDNTEAPVAGLTIEKYPGPGRPSKLLICVTVFAEPKLVPLELRLLLDDWSPKAVIVRNSSKGGPR